MKVVLWLVTVSLVVLAVGQLLGALKANYRPMPDAGYFGESGDEDEAEFAIGGVIEIVAWMLVVSGALFALLQLAWF